MDHDYVALLVEHGAIAIRDDEVIDRGSHFELPYDGSYEATFAFRSPADTWMDHDPRWYADNDTTGGNKTKYLAETLKLRFYPKASADKPVIPVGRFRADGTVYRLRWSPFRLCTNAISVTNSYFRRTPGVYRTAIEITRRQYGEVRPFSVAELGRDERWVYMVSLARELSYSGQLSPERATAIEQALWGTTSGPAVHWRNGGTRLAASQYMHLRGVCQRLGKAIAKADADSDADSDPATTVCADLDVLAGHNMVAGAESAWNFRAGEEVQLLTCGHYAFESQTHHLRRGRTACYDCYEDASTVVYLEDEDEHDLASYAYQHDNGEWYSYPEDDGDGDDGDGEHDYVRGYTTNVCDSLPPDRSIKVSPYGDFLMGIELEVVPKGRHNHGSCVEHTDDSLCQDYAILKHDGSLDDGGFEIVTAPRGLAEHIERLTEWKPHNALRAWDPGCCGMHVHISSGAFTRVTLGKFIEFINSEENDELILAIAGRHPQFNDQAADYCQRDSVTSPGNPKKVCEDKSIDRYRMVNTSNIRASECLRLGLVYNEDTYRHQNTVELRVFRASLKKERLLAQVEFAHAAVMFCRWSSMRELRREHFIKWLQGMAGLYPNLAKWFGVRSNTDVVTAHPKARQGAEV